MNSALLVDDDSFVVRALERLLTHHCDLDVVRAYSVLAALDTLEVRRFDVLVCDATMPGLSGPTLLKIASERWPEMRRVLYSGYIEHGSYMPGHEFADERLGKTTDPVEVAQTICRLAQTPRAVK